MIIILNEKKGHQLRKYYSLDIVFYIILKHLSNIEIGGELNFPNRIVEISLLES